MANVLLGAQEVTVPSRSGGLLEAALPAPQGWEQGLSLPFYGCGEPRLQDRCVTANDAVHTPSSAEFLPFGISQGSECSTLSRVDQRRHAEGRLDATTEWAVGRQLATDAMGLRSPSLANSTGLGTLQWFDVGAGVAALEQAAADKGYGAQWWVHVPIQAVNLLALYFDPRATRLQLFSGAPVVASPGYPGGASGQIRLWVTGPVWAAVSDPLTMDDVDRNTNRQTAYAERSAIVAFDPCINFHIDVPLPEPTR